MAFLEWLRGREVISLELEPFLPSLYNRIVKRTDLFAKFIFFFLSSRKTMRQIGRLEN
jgi:hypothetical protein